MKSQLLFISPTQLRRAADLKERMEALQNELEAILGVPPQLGTRPAALKKRRMSAAGRARIAAAARARWAGIKGTASPAASGRKPKRKMSVAAKARLSALARARWKKAKAQGRSTL